MKFDNKESDTIETTLFTKEDVKNKVEAVDQHGVIWTANRWHTLGGSGFPIKFSNDRYQYGVWFSREGVSNIEDVFESKEYWRLTKKQ